MNYVLAALVAGVIAMLYLARRRTVFVLEIRDRKPRLRSGTVPGRFMADVEEWLESTDMPDGVVTGHRDGKQTKLSFSGSIPERYRQRFRNVWQVNRK